MIPRRLNSFAPGHFLTREELRPFIFGHRGYSSRAPENSMAAFRECKAAGIPGLELDVHLTSDGGVVIIHDHSLERTAGAPGRVEEKTLEELCRLDIGSWYSPQFAEERIPSLRSLFEAFGDVFYYDIELKDEVHGDSGLAAAVLAEIRRAGLAHRCFISSFNPYPLMQVKKLEPKVPTAIIYSTDKGVPPILRHGLGRFIAAADIQKPAYRQAGPAVSSWFRKVEGRMVIPWTVDDAETGKRLLAGGADGLISNDPEIHLVNSGAVQ